MHIRRRFNELVDASGRLPQSSLSLLVMRAGLHVPADEVADFALRWGHNPLTWGQVFPWIDERRRQAEGEHPYSRDGSHPGDTSELVYCGLSRVGFPAALRELSLMLCPPSPLCGCRACGESLLKNLRWWASDCIYYDLFLPTCSS